MQNFERLDVIAGRWLINGYTIILLFFLVIIVILSLYLFWHNTKPINRKYTAFGLSVSPLALLIFFACYFKLTVGNFLNSALTALCASIVICGLILLVSLGALTGGGK